MLTKKRHNALKCVDYTLLVKKRQWKVRGFLYQQQRTNKPCPNNNVKVYQISTHMNNSADIDNLPVNKIALFH